MVVSIVIKHELFYSTLLDIVCVQLNGSNHGYVSLVIQLNFSHLLIHFSDPTVLLVTI